MELNNLELLEQYQRLQQNQESQKFLPNPLIQKDIWDVVDDLSLKVTEHFIARTLNFSDISQEWLKLLAKKFILLISKRGNKSYTLINKLLYIKGFSRFLVQHSVYSYEQINDQVFEAFDYYLRSKNLKERTLRGYHGTLCQFFDTCRFEGWLNINTFWFRGRGKRTTINNDKIEYIPEEVWHQLHESLHYLPEQLQRMVIVIKTLGLRIGELCNMPFDCLRKRGKAWRIRISTEKYDTEDELPISPELVAVIREQQEYIRQNLGEAFDKLFSANKRSGLANWRFFPQPKVMKGCSFNFWLNKLAKKCNICTKEGELWHFRSHQFRRTVATVMENAGIRDLIIQKYLRHRSADMQRHYTHLLKQVLGDELKELMRDKKYIDITGKVVALHKPTNLVTEALRRRMYQITTQYGECHRPSLKSPCPTVNACWRCKDWRISEGDLPHLKEDLNRVEKELQTAESLGMTRQQIGLEGDRNILFHCITSLENIND